ncbi:signal peptidase I [Robbsia sp. Bb-Pol-6]|uniref:Signal peptidase I n=1 Tax=Robbsia betulipollinis TaxID=2981849 RepID=A0ABT3ZR43_9BURK|nr:signal peptidase I [Robbsia betulipollinis]MCY0389029.1 signal peptidase I [Robbsia betulipollinis]
MNFGWILFVLTLVTGLFWIVDRGVFLPRRRYAANAALAEIAQAPDRTGRPVVDPDVLRAKAEAKRRALRRPFWLEYSAGFFPVILVVFLIRSFLAEPFRIPSGSMIPTLRVGDFILVNKFDYGVRSPIGERKLLANHDPRRGDVVVFRSPEAPSIDLIKRVVGVPGDVVQYRDKHLTINGSAVPEHEIADFKGEAVEGRVGDWKQYEESFDGRTHAILRMPAQPTYTASGVRDFPNKGNCRYDADGFVCKVPPGNYFMMGDNRDNSDDSRYWGFAPDANIVGRAMVVWMNLGDLGRVGHRAY